jgi:hypothetical protein
MNFLLFTLLFLSCWEGGNCDALEALNIAVHGELAGDQDYREEMELDLSPPPDQSPLAFASVPDTSLWDLEESEIAADLEKVDEWEALPLPASHHQEQLMKDSEEMAGEGSEARRELEVLVEAWSGDNKVGGEINEALEVQEGEHVGKVDAKVVIEEILIFNTDDFDGKESDVEDSSPMVPL